MTSLANYSDIPVVFLSTSPLYGENINSTLVVVGKRLSAQTKKAATQVTK